MKILKIHFICIILFTAGGLSYAQDFCISCHRDLDDAPSKLFIQDVHNKAGLSCSSCHGGNSRQEDMELAMSRQEGFIGVPAGDKISEICSRCHSDQSFMQKYNKNTGAKQLSELTASVHGRKDVNGKNRILQCTTCHNYHGIRKVNDPASPVYPANVPATCGKCHSNAEYMRNYNASLPVDQVTKYRTSVHGELNKKGNPKAAECSSCHGSHYILSSGDVRSTVYKLNIPETCSSCHSDKEYMKEFSIPTDQFAKFRNSAHGKAVFDKKDISAPVCNDCHGNHGATPPGISSISNVCGNCHALNAELFSGSPHKQVFDQNKFPECETCHGSHEILSAKDQLLGVDRGAVCSKCHTESKNRKGYDAAIRMSRVIDSLIMYDSTARRLVFQAEQKGMEIEEAKFMLREIHQSRLEARTILHSFSEEKFREVTDKGIKTAGYVITDAQEAIDEFYFRRYGLGAAVFIISFLTVTIFLYIRKIERK